MKSQVLWFDSEFQPTNLSEYQDDPNHFLNISEAAESDDEVRNSTYSSDIEEFKTIHPKILLIGLLILVLSIVLQAFSIKYERFGLDPMKRGFTNQVNKSYYLAFDPILFILLEFFHRSYRLILP